MNPADVCAVIYGEGAEVEAALAAQCRQPYSVLALPERSLLAAVHAGHARGCSWLWLLDGFAVPEPEALEALLAATATAPGPAPLLLASKVIDGQGRLHPDSTPRHEIFEKAHSIDAAEHHLVQLRAAAHGSVLVARRAIDRFGPPRPRLPAGLDMWEWSLRILRDWEDTGYLVPASVAVRAQPGRDASARELLGRVRVLASPGWRPSERLWEAFLVGRETVRWMSAAPGQGRAGVGAPDFRPSTTPRQMTEIEPRAKRLPRR